MRVEDRRLVRGNMLKKELSGVLEHLEDYHAFNGYFSLAYREPLNCLLKIFYGGIWKVI